MGRELLRRRRFASPEHRPALRFAHLTDLHFTTLLQRRYPLGIQALEAAIADLNKQDLDFVVITGDLFHFPERIPEELPVLRSLLDRLRHPYYLAFGNHDVEGAGTAARKATLMAGLGDRGLSRGTPWYDFALPQAPGLRFVVLDSTDIEGEDYHTWRGRFSERQATWLARTLDEVRDQAVVVAIHHPPVTPYPFMNSLKFEDADRDRLERVLDTHPHIAMVLSGHYHMAGRTPLGRTSVLTGPSLVEHPHAYRIFSFADQEVSYSWRSVAVSGIEMPRRHTARARIRGMALYRLSRSRAGSLLLPRADRTGSLTSSTK